MTELYDLIGSSYTVRRQPDPRIAAASAQPLRERALFWTWVPALAPMNLLILR